MINVMMYLGVYILAILAISLTVGLAWFLIVGRSLAKKNTVFDKELDAMRQRIKKRNELNGRATDHTIDLKLNEPHPYYAREVENEQRSHKETGRR